MRSKLLVMALCATTLIAGCNSNKAKATAIVNFNPMGPSSLPECRDGINNDPWEDNLKDAEDPGCHYDGNAGNPNSYVPDDNTEAGNGGPGSPTNNAGPGPFNIDRNSVSCKQAEFNEFRVSFPWSASQGASSYRVERRGGPSNNGNWEVQRPDQYTSFNGTSFAQFRVRPDYSYDYRVVAVNSAGERLGNPAEFRACDAVHIPPPVVVTPPTAPPTGGGTTPPTGGGTTPPTGGGTTPPTGGSCSTASAALPSGGTKAKGTSLGFQISAPDGCTWSLTSTDPAKVSVNPATGSGTKTGSLYFMNVGSATVCFSGGGCQSYTVQ